MGRALPRVDDSASWPAHSCGATHHPAVACPPAGWLVLQLCTQGCSTRYGVYCRAHRS
jgi:hypothetical protein